MEIEKRKKKPLTLELKFDYKDIPLTIKVTQWLSTRADIGHYNLIIEDEERNIVYSTFSTGCAPDTLTIQWLNDTVKQICKYGIDNLDESEWN